MNTIYIQNVIYTIYMNNYFVNLICFYSRKIQYLHVTVNNSIMIISFWEFIFIFCMIFILTAVWDLNPASFSWSYPHGMFILCSRDHTQIFCIEGAEVQDMMQPNSEFIYFLFTFTKLLDQVCYLDIWPTSYKDEVILNKNIFCI